MYLVSRTDTFAKLFFIISFVGLFMYLVLAFYTFHSSFISNINMKAFQKRIQFFNDPDVAPVRNNELMKYILMWTKHDTEWEIDEGQEIFIKHDCLHQNCYITTDKDMIDDYTNFDAVVFNSLDLKRWNRTLLPAKRSWDQKYIFFGKNVSTSVPICNAQADSFFNWTWSYKLYSDIISPFFKVYNLKGEVVAPNAQTVWQKKIYDPIDFMGNNKITKTKAMVTILKYCGTPLGSQILKVAKSIQIYLRKEKLEFDIFGCQNVRGDVNFTKIKRDYYFYWIYDQYYAEDYVTDEILIAVETDTVPIVSGLSDYSKFLPPSSYIDSKHLELEDLGAILYYNIKNIQVYLSYFRWKEHYTIKRVSLYEGVCQLCSKLNNEMLMRRHTHYEIFRRWWFPGPLDQYCLVHPKDNDTMPDFGDKVKGFEKI